MTVTLKDVAERAGVSRSAVSRAFTAGASVSPATRRRIEIAAAELGYSPNIIARGLATKRTKLIGLVANNFQNPAFLEVFDLYTRELQQRGFRPLLVNLTNETDPEHAALMLRQYSVDGVIVASSTLPPDFARAFRAAKVPVVQAFGRFDAALNVPVVGIDNVLCGRMAAETLSARGYQRIAVIGGPEAATSTQDRVAGFVPRMKELGRAAQRIIYASRYSYEAGRIAMAELLEGVPPDAVFCGNDLIALGAMDEARAQGVAIPADVGILGFDDVAMAAWESYRLTTIRQPLRDITIASVSLILDLVQGPPRAPEALLFPCELVERSTLRPPI